MIAESINPRISAKSVDFDADFADFTDFADFNVDSPDYNSDFVDFDSDFNVDFADFADFTDFGIKLLKLTIMFSFPSEDPGGNINFFFFFF